MELAATLAVVFGMPLGLLAAFRSNMGVVCFSASSVHGYRLLMHIAIALILGALLWLELPMLSGASWMLETQSLRAWDVLDAFQSPIIAIGIALSLITSLHNSKHGKKSKKH